MTQAENLQKVQTVETDQKDFLSSSVDTGLQQEF